MQKTDPTVIISAKRTAMGHFGGAFKDTCAQLLGAATLKAALEDINIAHQDIDAVIMGCVLSAGLGQAPARQAALFAGLANHTVCTTINKMCGSGLESVIIASNAIQAESANLIIAGGMENMSQAPFLLDGARFGYRIGTQTINDHMILDGLTDAFNKQSMGEVAEYCAEKFNITREQQDQFTITSIQRAIKAANTGLFSSEIVAVNGLTTDESIKKVKLEKISTLKPAFKKNGTITAANASSISDGAAALCLTRASYAKAHDIIPIATIVGHQVIAQDPTWFTTAPIKAIEQLLCKVNWSINEVDLFEINEAFAVVVLVAMQQLHIPREKVNIHGGACVLGHPIGASGARILTTLIYGLKQQQKKKGVASICIGGGEAIAIAIEVT